MRQLLPILPITIYVLAGCTNEQHQHAHPANGAKSRPASTGESAASVREHAVRQPGEQGVFDRYDAVEQQLLNWNAAINDHPEALGGLYADEVTYYLQTLRPQQCADHKISWLAAHPGYKQEIAALEVYYMEADTSGQVLIAEFDKICTDRNKKTTVPSLVYFSRFNGEWKITQETDKATEVNRAKKTKAGTLKRGDLVFYRGYWEDTRTIPGFAHDQVPYRMSLELHVADDRITGNYWNYSGTLRSTSHYLVTAGTVDKGTLYLTVAYNPDELTLEAYMEENGDDPAEAEQLSFRIVNGNELVNLDPDNGYLYGKSLALQKK